MPCGRKATRSRRCPAAATAWCRFPTRRSPSRSQRLLRPGFWIGSVRGRRDRVDQRRRPCARARRGRRGHRGAGVAADGRPRAARPHLGVARRRCVLLGGAAAAGVAGGGRLARAGRGARNRRGARVARTARPRSSGPTTCSSAAARSRACCSRWPPSPTASTGWSSASVSTCVGRSCPATDAPAAAYLRESTGASVPEVVAALLDGIASAYRRWVDGRLRGAARRLRVATHALGPSRACEWPRRVCDRPRESCAGSTSRALAGRVGAGRRARRSR